MAELTRPWHKLSTKHAVPLQFSGHPAAELEPWWDRSTKILQVHAASIKHVANMRHKYFWLPHEPWRKIRDKVEKVEWCVRSDMTCYKISGEHARMYGRARERGRRGERLADRAWTVAMRRCEKVRLYGDGSKATKLKV